MPRILILCAVIFSCAIALNVVHDDSIFHLRDTFDVNYKLKDTHLYVLIIIFGNFIFLFLSMITYTWAWKYTGRNNSDRKNESLNLNNGVIEYEYQNCFDSNEYAKEVVQLPLYEMTRISYKRGTQEITFRGRYSNVHFLDYESGITESDESLQRGKFVIFDYFKPSLINILIREGIEGIEFHK